MIPAGVIQIRFQRREAFSMFTDKRLIQNRRLAGFKRVIMHSQQRFHHPFEHGRIAANAHFIVG